MKQTGVTINGYSTLPLTLQIQYAIIESIRYEMGRATASTGDIARYLLSQNLYEVMDIVILETIRDDIACWLGERERGGKHPAEIYEHDVKPFIDLRERIIEELDSRRVSSSELNKSS